MKKSINLSLPIFDITGKKTTRAVSLSADIFKEKVNDKLIAQYIRVYLFNKRNWNASTKTRGEINASKRKIYKQKGTGRARHGAKSAPIFVGGGVIGGPQPKNKKLSINKKQKRKAFFGSLSQAINEDKIMILADSCLKIKIKTKQVVNFLNKMKLTNNKIILVYPKENSNSIYLSSRNIKNVNLCLPNNLNTYKVLRSKKIIFIEEALKVFQNHFLKNEK